MSKYSQSQSIPYGEECAYILWSLTALHVCTHGLEMPPYRTGLSILIGVALHSRIRRKVCRVGAKVLAKLNLCALVFYAQSMLLTT